MDRVGKMNSRRREGGEEGGWGETSVDGGGLEEGWRKEGRIDEGGMKDSRGKKGRGKGGRRQV